MSKDLWDKYNIIDKLELIEGWVRRGLTEKDICHNLSVGVTTFNKWKLQHSEIVEVLKKGKEIADIKVENALYKRAIGYTYEEVIKEVRFNQETKKYEKVATKKVTKEVSADVTAIIFWLKNRRPDLWKDKQEIAGLLPEGFDIRIIN